MNQWSFVLAAYSVTALATIVLVVASWRAMRRAEAAAERERGGEGRMAALFGLVGAVNLPIIHYSVLWWRTLHQGQSISLGGGSSIAPELLWPLPLTMIGFTSLFAAVALMRMRTDLALLKRDARLLRAASE